jgi:hypothetical protein
MPLRLGAAILSMPNERHRRLRCFQRASLLAGIAYTPPRADNNARRGWLSLHGGGYLLLRYIVTRTQDASLQDALNLEDQNHGDLLLVDILDGTLTCFSKVVFALRQLAAADPRPHFITVFDDDSFINPTRLEQDLAPLIAHGREVFYGQVAFVAGWSTKSLLHYGYGLYNVDAKRLFNRWRDRRGADPGPGPFPVAYGYAMTVSVGLALRVAGSPAVAGVEQELLERARRNQHVKRPPGAWQV